MTVPVFDHLSTLREKNPLIHNITNYVVMNNTANALLAVGASPAMIHAVEEATGFAAISSALVINIGTLSSHWIEAMHNAANIVNENRTPWVLDPVGIGATKLRTDTVRDLLKHCPTIIRGNASEILAVVSSNQVSGKGVDSTIDTNDVRAVAKEFAAENNLVLAITGATDYITDGIRETSLQNGHPMMAKVTGMGCSSTAMVGAFLGAGIEPYEAAVAALAIFGVAGEIAAEKAEGPGSLQMKILDVLYNLSENDITTRMKIDDSITAL